jgi:hypothetical protein
MHVFDGHRAFSGYCQYWAWFVTCNAICKLGTNE